MQFVIINVAPGIVCFSHLFDDFQMAVIQSSQISSARITNCEILPSIMASSTGKVGLFRPVSSRYDSLVPQPLLQCTTRIISSSAKP